MSRKKWVVAGCDRDMAAEIAENCGIDPFAAYLLCARGICDEFEIDSFLYDTELSDPFELPDMEKACKYINAALDNGEKITVFGDYDADGVTSTALLYSYLCSCGANVDYYIPDRETEGYGMNLGAIDEIKSRGTTLIITVDNGISALEEIAYAASLGITTVVTDHHRAGDALPEAAAVVDPHIDGSFCDFKDWAGVGVAFKLVCALDGDDGYNLLYKFADLVALGTVADIVPLHGENRVLVKAGINLLNTLLSEGALRPGIKALLDASGFNQSSVTASDAAYRLAPRINAAGRMGSAKRALKLLLTDNMDIARELAEDISNANTERQTIEKAISEKAEKLLSRNPSLKAQRVIIVDGEGWHKGVIGIVASRLVEKFGKPAIVISREGNICKGSGRSVEGFSLYDALFYARDTLTQFGGHTLAAGMTLEASRLCEFREKINEYAEKASTSMPVLRLDCKLNPASVNLSLLSSIELLEPFGAENPQPIFGLFNMKITEIRAMGAGKHLRLTLLKKNVSVTAVLFSKTLEEFPFISGDTVDVAVKLSENEYMGEKKVSIQIKDIKLSGSDDDKLWRCLCTYEAFNRGETLSQDEKALLLPDRQLCSAVYKYLKRYVGKVLDCEILAHRLGLPTEKTGALRVALDALCELKVLKEKDGIYSIPEESVKVDLSSSLILKKLSE